MERTTQCRLDKAEEQYAALPRFTIDARDSFAASVLRLLALARENHPCGALHAEVIDGMRAAADLMTEWREAGDVAEDCVLRHLPDRLLRRELVRRGYAVQTGVADVDVASVD